MAVAACDTLRLARSLREKAKLSPEQAELRLEKQIEAGTAEILKWMSGTIGLQTLAILGAVLALARVVRI